MLIIAPDTLEVLVNSPSILLGQLRAIRGRVVDATRRQQNVHFTICGALNQTRNLMISDLQGDVGKMVGAFTAPIASSKGEPPYPEKGDVALLLCDQLIEILTPLVDRHNAGATAGVINRIAPDSRSVFIVHGHDEVNLLRLSAMLKDRFNLKPIILMDEASGGETVIEKFERLANEAAYCIVLLTPDDQILSADGAKGQARPNAIFELGWFYGRLGRSRVCILMKRGTSIHSDLAGIVRVEFIERVEEAVPTLERELGRAGF